MPPLGHVVDVRSPAEYKNGHIPGAISAPIFDDAERASVGTTYVKLGREQAVIKGLELIGSKMHVYAQNILSACAQKTAFIYCWRGGMRSRSVAFLLELAGCKTFLLEGGYKSYRNFLLREFEKPAQVIVLGGLTGSGKTDCLHELERRGEQVLDIEGIAKHKGSAFGHIGLDEQPPTEHFQNLLFEKWHSFDLTKPIFLEDENSDLGKVNLPEPLFAKIRSSDIIILEMPVNARVQKLVAEYTGTDDELLTAAVKRLERRLGSEKMQKAVSDIENGNYHGACEILLTYYDKAYLKSVDNREKQTIVNIQTDTADARINAELILKMVKEL
jgi:tRNA 2-selenouridine synthase